MLNTACTSMAIVVDVTRASAAHTTVSNFMDLCLIVVSFACTNVTR
jgi:hypothetical protein